jgi:hypothetical protein
MLILQRFLTWLKFKGIKNFNKTRRKSKESTFGQNLCAAPSTKAKNWFNVARVFNEENFYRHEINCCSGGSKNSSALIKILVVSRMRSYFAIFLKSTLFHFFIHSSSSSMSQRHENGIMTGFGFTNFFNSFLHPSILQQSLRSYSIIGIADNYCSRCRKRGEEVRWALRNWRNAVDRKVHCGSKRDVLEVMKTLSLCSALLSY